MNKIYIFIGGFVAGVVLTAAVALGIYFYKTPNTQPAPETVTETETEDAPQGVNIFDEPGEIINEKSFKVFQVIAQDAALVRGKGSGYKLYVGPVYLLVNDEKKYYYDDEVVNVPKGKVVRQIGIYQYPTRDDRYKTVPIIEFLDQ